MPLATPHIQRGVTDKHVAYRTSKTLPDTYDLNWNPPASCKTGCWKYDTNSQRHIISVSIQAYNSIADSNIGRFRVGELFVRVYEHEAAHSLYTTRDLKALGDKLAAEKIPWRLCNLFEDVRIERMWFKYVARKHFGWKKWSRVVNPANMSPTELLYRLKCESIGRSFPRSASALRTNQYFDRVWWYFNQIIRLAYTSNKTEDLIPLLKQWLKEFPQTGDDGIADEPGGLGTGDLGDAITQSGGKVTNQKGKAPPTTPQQGSLSHDPAHGLGTAGASDQPANSGIPNEAQLATQLARKLALAFKANGIGKNVTSNPSKRLNIKGLLRGDWSRPFIGKTNSDEGVPYVPILFDLSGSMGSQMAWADSRNVGISNAACSAADCGRVLIRALSILAARGLIRGKVFASGQGGVQNEWDLPIKSSAAYLSLKGEQGSDGLVIALDPKNQSYTGSRLNFIKGKSKLAIIYSDGEYSDTLDCASLNSRGLYTLGLCCTSKDKTLKLKRHFNYIISRESLDALADALVRFLKSVKF